jgi:hypothetical protein
LNIRLRRMVSAALPLGHAESPSRKLIARSSAAEMDQRNEPLRPISDIDRQESKTTLPALS